MKTSAPDSKTSRRATLNDIARHAGVTVGTASGVLRDKAKERRISAEVVERVLLAAKEMDYAPNLLVRSLHRGHTQVLSFFNGFRSRDRRDYYMDALTTSVEQAGGALGYNILVLCDFAHSAEDTYKYIKGGINDGLIFFKPHESDPLLPFLRRSNLPVVLLNAIDEEGILSSVTDDGQSGIREAARQILSAGHRRIAMLSAEPRVTDARNRTALFKSCLLESGIELRSDWIMEVDGKDSPAVNACVKHLMSYENPPTALFCWHDYVGYRALEECHNLGIVVPEQLSIVGYDGVRWPARTTHMLASVSVDLEAISKLAVEILVDLVREDSVPPIQKVVPVHFEPGTTLGPAPS
jgi:DNA-binding LacI/PurR family transcriptional regulator